MTTGERIKFYRIKRNLTQKQLGELCGIDEANIRKYEANKQNIQINTLEKIINALSLTFEEFYREYIIIPEKEPLQLQLDECPPKEHEISFLNTMEVLGKKLNDTGQDKAIEQVELLTKIPEYRKDTPDDDQ